MSQMKTAYVILVTDQDGYDIPVKVALSLKSAQRAADEFIKEQANNPYWRLDTLMIEEVELVDEIPKAVSKKGYNPRPDGVRRPSKPTPAPPSKAIFRIVANKL